MGNQRSQRGIKDVLVSYLAMKALVEYQDSARVIHIRLRELEEEADPSQHLIDKQRSGLEFFEGEIQIIENWARGE